MSRPSPSVAALIVAAGRGTRAGDGLPKQYRPLAGRPVLGRAADPLIASSLVGRVVVVIDPSDRDHLDAALPQAGKVLPPVAGGATRQASVLAGLESLAADPPDIVLVHDAARPFASVDLVAAAVAQITGGAAGAVPGLPVVDTIKTVDQLGRVVATPDRATLRAVQTPQAFSYPALLAAHRAAAAQGIAGLTDDASVMEWAGHAVVVIPGEADNIKITHPQDFAEAERRLAGGAMLNDIRIGQGYDVHAFAEGDHVWLGGIRIAHDRGVLAHSDGDVVLHAATDAILGALADGDIGTHFPPSDPQWKGASSDRFLAHAAGLLAARGGRLAMLDVTVVCEAPKIGPHREAIRARMAEILGVGPDRIAIKATTSEKMGFTGRREGLAALALATIRLPGDGA
ncbi:bifunctional 2-C-methyl-D-erythritol 4-phosphate cytidylyltransferase/2-C-methyl-D-erythritol 2,4-cyclodiphosphate synthase [Phreatobacter oligotrophus]|jgi:2-C-methyl-D-erythritol 4-phosphate cytidylyltransferase / 2-C-methyl-D-erythritol 2,4-cyclodiphosphate synthase|uniref:bifunctional 2-C-methyl-D-erythritol 4-phosphate cytidylyltransferase/2-C-methyl-D-erythritol 2,4-cyclodiphosphate synthase n=1 Tax=Phreatobacter oligotrophus TaxID=1122261 RepID=UPI002357A9E9|nr:bifunctional 2-C-methyl-D-erythritol 4-phosphate cytidylyltransferase/2-C-methyl-D-erythritol 2,4-cyclodiphosphate synthase [Phreatobacter oligotrophus]MBX9989823.1 bifunctional 2-C-methyl-D-erythritol 4-phosphate cytidylyltransferase/2-C-methyl-D-erythritol 2,4-cyclodiphosphate synthase [Phreatobacter oligotrophus]